MRHLGVTIAHVDADHLDINQTMIKHPKKLVLVSSYEKRQLNLTYEQAFDLKEQLIDFLGDYTPVHD